MMAAFLHWVQELVCQVQELACLCRVLEFSFQGLCIYQPSQAKVAVMFVCQTRELMGLCEDSVLCSAADMYVQAKRRGGGDGQDLASSLPNVNASNFPQLPDNTHRWSGSNFVKSPTTEPWVRSSLVSLCSVFNTFHTMKQGHHSS